MRIYIYIFIIYNRTQEAAYEKLNHQLSSGMIRRSIESTIDLTVASVSENFHRSLCKSSNVNWSKFFKLPILRGNDKIGIQIVKNYLYVYIDGQEKLYT